MKTYGFVHHSDQTTYENIRLFAPFGAENYEHIWLLRHSDQKAYEHTLISICIGIVALSITNQHKPLRRPKHPCHHCAYVDGDGDAENGDDDEATTTPMTIAIIGSSVVVSAIAIIVMMFF